jgi:hypothetical protein
VSAYIEPTYRPEERVSPRDCFARAQRALEAAEMQIKAVNDAGVGLTVADALANAEAQARIGEAWAVLGAAVAGGR